MNVSTTDMLLIYLIAAILFLGFVLMALPTLIHGPKKKVK